MADVVVIGGGAAGMAAAICAGECGDRVVLLERMDRVGKKLLATGNGRCNLMNTGEARYPGGAAFAEAVLARCGAAEQTIFWRQHGLFLREEDAGRVYPASGQASTVLDVLRLSLEKAGVETVTSCQVTGLRRKHGRWTVQTEQGGYPCDRVIVAGGGCAQPKLGSDGSCWPLLSDLGHQVVKATPSLTQIETEQAPIRGLSGIRVRAQVTVLHDGAPVHMEEGEALFADYGMSGVCVMQCARYAHKGDTLSLNLLAGLKLTEQELLDELRRRVRSLKERPMEQLLTGLVVPRLGSALCARAGIRWNGRFVGDLTEQDVVRLCRVFAAFDLEIRGKHGFENAQVVSGGAATEEFSPDTLASKIADGIYACGEVLDVDGDCGGFNLMFAFGSGILAGLDGRESAHRRK